MGSAVSLVNNTSAQYNLSIVFIVLIVFVAVGFILFILFGKNLSLGQNSTEVISIVVSYIIITITYIVLITNGNMASCDSKKESNDSVKAAFSIGIIFIFLLMLYCLYKFFLLGNFDNINNTNVITTILPSVCFFMSYSALSLSLIKVIHS